MLFVSKLFNFRHEIQSDVTAPVQTPQGFQTMTITPGITAQFRNWQQRDLPEYAKLIALEFFDNLDGNSIGEPPGAYRKPGHASDPDFALMTYDGSDYAYHFSSFDTDEDCPNVPGMKREDVKALVEKTLLESPDFGSTFILVSREQLKPPWASYDEMRLEPGAHNKIPSLVRKTGRDVHEVIAYESAHAEPMQGVLDGLKKLRDEQDEARRELEALSVEV